MEVGILSEYSSCSVRESSGDCFRVFNNMKKTEDTDAQIQNEFILNQLLQLAGLLDITDTVGR